MDRASELWESLSRPLPKDDFASALMSTDPFERAAYRVRQGARPEGGRQEGAFSEALSDPATVPNALKALWGITPPGALHNFYQDARAGNYSDAALHAVPFAGPALRAAGEAVTAAPRVAAGAIGGLAALTAAEAGDRNPKNPEWWRSEREVPPTIDRFTEPTFTPEEEARYLAPQIQGLDKLGPMGRLKATEQRGVTQDKLLADRKVALREKTARARADYDEMVRQKQAAYEAEQSRLDAEDQKYREANQSFREAHPIAAPIMQGVGAATALGFPLVSRYLGRRANNTMADQLQEAITAGEAAGSARGVGSGAARVGARQRLESAIGPQGVGRMKDTAVSPAGQVAWATGGGVEGATSAVAPYIVDQETLPIDSHGREESGAPTNWATRAAYGFIPGAAMGMLGSRIPMGRGAVPDIARAEGLIKGLGSKAKDLKVPAEAAASRPAPALPRRRRKELPPEGEQ